MCTFNIVGNISIFDTKANYSFMFFMYSKYSEITKQQWENVFLEFVINYNHYYLSERRYKQYTHRGRDKGGRENGEEEGRKVRISK